MNDILRVYLCGSIKKGNADKRSGFWTDTDIEELEEAVAPSKLTVLNPGKRKDDLSDVRATFGRDLLQVFTSHAILVDAREKRGVGVGAEMLFAKSNHIPVIAVAPRDSHYHRIDVTLMGQFVADWVHPFISELSDAVVESVYDAGRVAASLSTLPSGGGQDHFTDAMIHYLTTQASREPEMIALLTEAKGLPERAFQFLSNASLSPAR
jgi:hypothetical protein